MVKDSQTKPQHRTSPQKESQQQTLLVLQRLENASCPLLPPSLFPSYRRGTSQWQRPMDMSHYVLWVTQALLQVFLHRTCWFHHPTTTLIRQPGNRHRQQSWIKVWVERWKLARTKFTNMEESTSKPPPVPAPWIEGVWAGGRHEGQVKAGRHGARTIWHPLTSTRY